MPPRAEKTISNWIKRIPREVSVEEVKQVLAHFSISWRPGGKHNIVVNDSRLSGYGWYLGGNLSIPTVGGRMVKGHYIKNLIGALRMMGLIQEDSDG